MAEDFGDAHDGYVFCADDAGLSGALHVDAAEARKCCCWKGLAKGGDERGAVGVSGSFAGGEEDARVGFRGDDGSLSRGVILMGKWVFVGVSWRAGFADVEFLSPDVECVVGSGR